MSADAGWSGAAASPQPAAPPSRGQPGAGLRIAGAIGQEISAPLAEMQAIVQDFIRTGKIMRSQVQQLNTAIDHARDVARRSLGLAQLGTSQAGTSGEPLRVDIAVTRALAQRMPQLQSRGVMLEQQLTPMSATLDARVLSALLDAAIECCAARGSRLTVTLTTRGAPPHPVLTLHARPDTGAPVDAATLDLDRLCWHVVREVGALNATQIEHGVADGGRFLQLAFDAPAMPVGSDDFEDTSSAEASWMHSSSLGFGGHSILLISAQPALRAHVAHICEAMALPLTWAPSAALAESQVAMARPDLVLIDVRAEEPRTERLRQQLLASDPGYPWLRIHKEHALLSLEHWAQGHEEHLMPQNLRAMLPRQLLLRLSRRPPR